MRIFRAKAKNEPQTGIYTESTIYPGQMFFVDTYSDLPRYDESTFKEQWEELEVQTRFGFTKILVKP